MFFKRGQRGAALLIGLVLLSVLTLLAISAAGTAGTELFMAGNEQYRLRAAQAADIGIERVIAAAAFEAGAVDLTVEVPLSGGERYVLVVRPRGPTTTPAGYADTFTAEHFEIESTGFSHRGAKATHVQGLFVVRPHPAPAAASAPPACLHGVELRPLLCVPLGTVVRTYWRTAPQPDRS